MSGPRQQPRLFGAIAKQQLVPYLVGHGVAYQKIGFRRPVEAECRWPRIPTPVSRHTNPDFTILNKMSTIVFQWARKVFAIASESF